MTGGMHYTTSRTNVCKFSIFNLHFLSCYYTRNAETLQFYASENVLSSAGILFTFDLFEFSAAILEKGLLLSNPVPLPDLYFDSFSYPVAPIVSST